MGQPNGAEPLDEDGLNPRRALILQGYYALRRQRPANTIGTREIADWIKANEPEEDAPSAPANTIGTREIADWIKANEPEEDAPSASLTQQTLTKVGARHRGPGRPCAGPPFCPAWTPSGIRLGSKPQR